MVAALCIPAAAAELTPPQWVRAEEYAVFSDGAALEEENRARISRLRADAGAGNLYSNLSKTLAEDYCALETQSISAAARENVPGLSFEFGLIALRYRCNAIAAGQVLAKTVFLGTDAQRAFANAASHSAGQDKAAYLANFWKARSQLLDFQDLYAGSEEDMRDFASTLRTLYATPTFTTAALLDWDGAKLVGADIRSAVKDGIIVTLDGALVHPYLITYSPTKHELSAARSANGWTQVPVRRLAELIGADVSYNNGKVTLVRAGTTVVMTIGSKQATVNGKVLQMVTAPIKDNGRTYIPVRYIGEFFGQELNWVTPHELAITEKKTASASSNLEAWARPMGAMLNYMNGERRRNGLTLLFGGTPRVGNDANPHSGREIARGILNGNSWGIDSRADLIETVCSMTAHGHNDSFLSAVAWIKGMTASEYQEILKNAAGMDAYMFPYTKQLGQKWGSKGILCWDLFRMSNLVQWGYLAGYVTYDEALALLEPAAKALHDNFTSWDQAYENYLDGYNWWARNNVLGKNVWETTRGTYYQSMKKQEDGKAIFDNALFRTPVTGVTGVTAEGLLKSVS